LLRGGDVWNILIVMSSGGRVVGLSEGAVPLLQEEENCGCWGGGGGSHPAATLSLIDLKKTQCKTMPKKACGAIVVA